MPFLFLTTLTTANRVDLFRYELGLKLTTA